MKKKVTKTVKKKAPAKKKVVKKKKAPAVKKKSRKDPLKLAEAKGIIHERLPDKEKFINRFSVKSGTLGKIYIVWQNSETGEWGCTGWPPSKTNWACKKMNTLKSWMPRLLKITGKLTPASEKSPVALAFEKAKGE